MKDPIGYARRIAKEQSALYPQYSYRTAAETAQDAVEDWTSSRRLRLVDFKGYVMARIWLAWLLDEQYKQYKEECEMTVKKSNRPSVEIMQADRAKGMSIRAIAAKYNVPYQYVYRRIGKKEETMAYTKLTPKQRECIAEKLAGGAGVTALAKEYGVAENTIRSIKRANNGVIMAEELTPKERAELTDQLTELVNTPEQEQEVAQTDKHSPTELAGALIELLADYPDYIITVEHTDGAYIVDVQSESEGATLRRKDKHGED